MQGKARLLSDSEEGIFHKKKGGVESNLFCGDKRLIEKNKRKRDCLTLMH